MLYEPYEPYEPYELVTSDGSIYYQKNRFFDAW